jgi:hypothetical protein
MPLYPSANRFEPQMLLLRHQPESPFRLRLQPTLQRPTLKNPFFPLP